VDLGHGHWDPAPRERVENRPARPRQPEAAPGEMVGQLETCAHHHIAHVKVSCIISTQGVLSRFCFALASTPSTFLLTAATVNGVPSKHVSPNGYIRLSGETAHFDNRVLMAVR
jgi:hypothetical protein